MVFMSSCVHSNHTEIMKSIKLKHFQNKISKLWIELMSAQLRATEEFGLTWRIWACNLKTDKVFQIWCEVCQGHKRWHRHTKLAVERSAKLTRQQVEMIWIDQKDMQCKGCEWVGWTRGRWLQNGPFMDCLLLIKLYFWILSAWLI